MLFTVFLCSLVWFTVGFLVRPVWDQYQQTRAFKSQLRVVGRQSQLRHPSHLGQFPRPTVRVFDER